VHLLALSAREPHACFAQWLLWHPELTLTGLLPLGLCSKEPGVSWCVHRVALFGDFELAISVDANQTVEAAWYTLSCVCVRAQGELSFEDLDSS